MLQEVNKVRSNPQSFIPVLKAKLGKFKGNILWSPGMVGLMTDEGEAAIHEAIKFL